jgi:hypothetical protein
MISLPNRYPISINNAKKLTNMSRNYLYAVCVLVLSASSCKKSAGPSGSGGPYGQLSILSISPDHGPGATQVTISGSGFGSVTANDSFLFNGRNAVIQSVSDSTMTVIVPVRAGTGNTSVKVSGAAATGPQFTYEYTTTQVLFAGNGNINGIDGTGRAASFFFPTGVVLDPSGNLYVTQAANGSVRTITASAMVQTLLTPFPAPIDLGGGTPGVNTYDIVGITIDNSTGLIWEADPGADKVYYFKNAEPLVVNNLQDSFANSNNKVTPFQIPSGIAISNGSVYLTDVLSNNIQIINAKGDQVFSVINDGKDPGFSNLNQPIGIAVDADQNMFIANCAGNDILKITSSYAVSVFAGSSTRGTADGQGAAAGFFGPTGIIMDGFGTLYVTDAYNQRIRIISSAGFVTTLPMQYGISYPSGIAVTPDGSTLFVTDAVSCVIYKFSIQ